MPQPRKYDTDAERFRAYRERKRKKEEALRREVYLLSAKVERKKPSAPVPGSDALRLALLELRGKIPARRKEVRNWNMTEWVLDWIEQEMDRMLGIEHRPYGMPPPQPLATRTAARGKRKP